MVNHKESNPWEFPIDVSNMQELDSATELQGTSGVYLLTTKDGNGAAVFKPAKEEYLPGDVNGWGLFTGEGMGREKAAYLISEALGGFPGVPFTDITYIDSEVGCLQRFVEQCTDMSDLGPNGLLDSEVQKIAVMDLLTFNIDRHEGNILLQHRTKSLVPIDHAQCLPVVVTSTGANADMLSNLYFAWQTWPQAKAEWTTETRDLIAALSPEELAATINSQMREFSLPESALTTLKVGATVLKVGVALELPAATIADLIRNDLASLLDSAASAAIGSATWELTMLAQLDRNVRSFLTPDSDAETDLPAAVTEEGEASSVQMLASAPAATTAVKQSAIVELSAEAADLIAQEGRRFCALLARASSSMLLVMLQMARCPMSPEDVDPLSSSSSLCMHALRRGCGRAGAAAARSPLRLRATPYKQHKHVGGGAVVRVAHGLDGVV